MRASIRVFIRPRRALCGDSDRPLAHLPSGIGHIKTDLTAISCCHAIAATGPETLKNRWRLHSAARRTSDFLQVAPIETASARTTPLPSTRARGSPDRALTTSRYVSGGHFPGDDHIARNSLRLGRDLSSARTAANFRNSALNEASCTDACGNLSREARQQPSRVEDERQLGRYVDERGKKRIDNTKGCQHNP